MMIGKAICIGWLSTGQFAAKRTAGIWSILLWRVIVTIGSAEARRAYAASFPDVGDLRRFQRRHDLRMRMIARQYTPYRVRAR